MAIGGRDAEDVVGLPDIRVNFTVHIFQLIDLIDGRIAVAHGDAAKFFQGGGIPNTDLGTAIAHVDLPPVASEAPAFTGVLESAGLPEGLAVVNEADPILPGELQDAVFEDRDSFAEVDGGHIDLLQDFAGIGLYATQGGAVFETGALVEIAVAEFETLRECVTVVGKTFDDLVGISKGCLWLDKLAAGKRSDEDPEKAVHSNS